MLQLKIITPEKIILNQAVKSVTVPTYSGEITILLHHTNLFSLLVEGIVKIKKPELEEDLAIGGGYLETDGEEVNILVSKAYKQDELDAEIIEKAVEEAKEILKVSKDKKERAEANAVIRRSLVNLKLLKRRRPRETPV